MEKLKERYEIIIGYIGLILALSAFKDDVSKININIGFYVVNAANYLVGLIICLFFTLHLYMLTFVFSSTRYASLKIFSINESVTYFLFTFITLSPFLVIIFVAINYIISILSALSSTTKDTIYIVAQVLFSTIAGIISQIFSSKYKILKYVYEKEKLENREIKELETTQKLYNDGYYSQSILEAFKVLESHLKKIIIQQGVLFHSNKIQDIINIANKLKLLTPNENNTFNKIREMRNASAHLDVKYTKFQAEEAISFIKMLINKSNKINLSKEA